LYFVQRLQAVRASMVLGVFGMAHLPGMLAFWDSAAAAVPLALLDTPDQGLDASARLWLSVHGPDGLLARRAPGADDSDDPSPTTTPP
jgi:hypothetical protein